MFKKIDKLILNSFWAPYILSFFVAEFVLVMQFMWKYIDEILGKGFPFISLIKLIIYFAITIIPQAIPLTILISSIMVFGNLSEKYEIYSMKSAGVSLLRIMRPAILVALMTTGFSFVASNYLKPKANFKFSTLFFSMRKQKPSLSIEEGIFCKDFKDYVIRVGKKDKNDRDIQDVIIYDHTNIDRSLVNVITAKSGEMYSSEKNGFIMELRDGFQYQEMKRSPGKTSGSEDPLMRVAFESFTKVFDMSQFDVDENSLTRTRNKYDMLSQGQLAEAIDSLKVAMAEKKKETRYEFGGLVDLYPDKEEDVEVIPEDMADDRRTEALGELKDRVKSIDVKVPEKDIKLEDRIQKLKSTAQTNLKKKSKGTRPVNRNNKNTYTLKLMDTSDLSAYSSFYDLVDPSEQVELLEDAVRESNGFKNRYASNRALVHNMKRSINVYILRRHQQFSWALICLIFVFIGAPLGSIIRKGGYGYPLLVAIIFYVTYIISIIMGEKLIKSQSIHPVAAAWLPVIILTPFAILFTYMALRDVKINFLSWVQGLFIREEKKIASEHTTVK